jgi:HPt (histidine-containing phosphotransfer) domain-containing protein
VMPADKVKSAQAGMNDHVGKPFDIHHLVAVLQRYMPTGKVSDMPTRGTSNNEVALPLFGNAVREAAGVAGVDVDEAWARMGGRMDIQAHMLAGFVRDLKALFELSADGVCLTPDVSQREALSGNQLHRTLHTLKGSAGMLSANSLAQYLADEEKKLLDEGVDADRPAMIIRLRQAVQLVLAPLQALLEALTPLHTGPSIEREPRVISAEGVRATLQQLGQLLDGADMQAFKVYERLQVQGVTGENAVGSDLKQAMDTLEFEHAAMCCRTLLDATRS